MNVSTIITLERFECRCGMDIPCDCPPIEIEIHAIGVVTDLGDELDAHVEAACEVSGGRILFLDGGETTRCEDALCSEYERLEKLERAARRTLRLIPYVMPEATEC